jgi:transcription-repair coupling factor (superfamily II helicase)
VIVAYRDEKQKTKLISLFETIAVKTDEDDASRNISLVRDPFPLGMDFARQKLLIVPAAFIIAKSGAPKKNRRIKNADAFFADIKPGDYVVHDYHGIGRYERHRADGSDNITKDYI